MSLSFEATLLASSRVVYAPLCHRYWRGWSTTL